MCVDITLSKAKQKTKNNIVYRHYDTDGNYAIPFMCPSYCKTTTTFYINHVSNNSLYDLLFYKKYCL